MKTKSIFALFLFLFSTLSFANYSGDYCEFKGVYGNSNIPSKEEFAMLLDRIESPNFKEIVKAVAAVAISPQEDLNNSSCPIAKYARQLLEYYQENEQKIIESNKDKSFLKDFFSVISKKVRIEK